MVIEASTSIFLAGFVGAVAPEAVRLYGLAKAGARVTWSPVFYLATSVGIALLGGFVAVILPCENLRSAFFAGIATPTLIATVARKGLNIDGLDGSADADGPKKGLLPDGATTVPPRRLSRAEAFIRAL